MFLREVVRVVRSLVRSLERARLELSRKLRGASYTPRMRRLGPIHGVCPIVASALAALVAGAALAQDSTPNTTSTPSTPSTPSPAAKPAEKAPPNAVDAARDQRERSRELAENSLRRTLLPQAIEPAQFTAMLRAIDPALATNTDLAEAFTVYRAAIEVLALDPGREIAQLLPACYSFDGARGAFVTRPTPELNQLLALRDRAMRLATSAERALFRAVELATPIDHRGTLALEKIAFLQARLPRDGLLATTSVSLGDMLPRLQLTEAARALIAPTLLSYGDAFVLLLSTRLQLLRDNDAARAVIETRAGVLWRYRAADERAVIEDALDALDDAEFANELLLRDASLAALRRLRGQLPRTEGRRLVEEWQKTAHPELFDDERILSAIIGAVIALPEQDPEYDRAVLDAIDATYARIEPLAETACRAADAILPRLLDRTPAGISAELNARLTLLEAQKKRRVALKDTLSRIRATTANAPLATLARFDDFNASLAALERADRFERESLELLLDAMLNADEDAVDVTDPTQTPAVGTPKQAADAPNTTASKPSSTTSTPPRSSRGGRGSRKPVND